MPAQSDYEYAIRCEGLSRFYGEIKALDSLDLKVPKGAIYGFLGRNGAGKTTTMRLLTGLARPTSGSAWIAGVETTNGDPSAGYTYGYLPQQPVFYGWMRAWEYLDYVARFYKMDAKLRKKRVFEVLEQVGLKESAKRKIAGFSGGMKQRLGIAQAIVHNPQVLLLDEPTSALDPAGRYEVLDWIRSLNQQTTVFVSSHILDDIERVCDQIAILHRGKLVKVGERDSILAEYATNAVEIQVDGEGNGGLHTFAETTRTLPWVENVTIDHNVARIMVSDIQAGKQNLLQIVAQSGLPIVRMEWVRPSLEEVFLELSE
jgi:ABC-2 type transport system ATP-binding protein